MDCPKGIELYKKAKKIIPGGTQLLSKRPEMFLPDQWPAYYNKAKGCEVWDIDGNHYYDFAQMGVGSCIIGYADDDINEAVIKKDKNGSMSSLNSPEEVELAEKLIEIHPWAEMVRFARTGGEACAVAIRIARATTKKSKIAFCGYHGWHDWYISANIGDSSHLDGQLLPGLQPLGVPRELKNTALAFNYNKLDELEKLIEQYGNEIGVIIMEPQRGNPPVDGFLEGVRKIAAKIGAVLIFDEVTSGFRVNFGGIHLKLGVEPDVAVFGKALGNGFPISAIIGRKEVMENAQATFVSSTFWTERIGPAAALATIKKMEKNNVQKHLIHYGERINKGWKTIADKHDIKIKIDGIPPLTHISFVKNPLEVQTLYTQEMLKKGYLLGAAVYTTYSYTDEIIDKFIKDSDEVFAIIKEAIDSNNIKKYLKGDVKHGGFKRLT
ncbi:aminotransferase class III-fold pyridoxal phosphate-dependent enzyme [Candidatus Desantisbacteria bacterium]|nr:aminotransferase class III-fold pyridoxal phosphate-dependent enzyme [Candidatus Desantisbacteria bacterium]